MGYYYTNSAENAWPGKSWGMPKTHTPDPPVKERGQRFYMPELSRWVSRDPLYELRVSGVVYGQWTKVFAFRNMFGRLYSWLDQSGTI